MKWIKLAGFTAAFAMAVTLVDAAKVEWASGDVQANVNGSWQPLTAGMTIPDSATVKAGATGRAKIQMSNGASALIQPNSNAALSAGADNRVSRLARNGSRMENSNVSTVHGVRASSAVEELNAVPDLSAASPEERAAVEKAGKFVKENNYGDAIATLEAAVNANPYALFAQAHLGMVLYEAGDYISAAPHLRAAFENRVANVDLPSVVWMLMLSQSYAGDYTASNETAKRAVQEYTEHSGVPVWNLLRAENFIQMGNKVAAKDAIAEARRSAMVQVLNQTEGLIKDQEGKSLNELLAGSETVSKLFVSHESILKQANELANSLE